MTDKELNKLSKNNKVTHCYIKKGAYYRPNHCGYTDYITRAGVYTKEEAIREATGCREIQLVPINITVHNKRIIEEIKELAERIIKTP